MNQSQCVFLSRDGMCVNQQSQHHKRGCPHIQHWDRCEKHVDNLQPIWVWKDKSNFFNETVKKEE